MIKVNLKDFRIGIETTIQGHMIIKNVEVKSGSNGNFLSMTVSDGCQDLDCKKWNFNEKLEFKVGDVVHLVGKRNLFNNRVSAILSSVETDESVDPKEFLKHSDYTEQSLAEVIEPALDSIEDYELKMITKSLYAENIELFYEVPAAVGHHHDYLRGLAEHTMQVLTGVLNTYSLYEKELNRDLLICGAILHDIGKVRCYELIDGVPSMTKEGKFFDHIVIGSEMLHDKIRELDFNETEEKFMKLKHIILAHHGKREWGSPVVPCFLEALVVSRADDDSAKIVGMKKELDLVDDEWSNSKSYVFDCRLYKGNKEEDECYESN